MGVTEGAAGLCPLPATVPVRFYGHPLDTFFHWSILQEQAEEMKINVPLLSCRMALLLLLTFPTGETIAQKKETALRQGMVITGSITVKKGTYHFQDLDSLTPALIVDGNNITIDFNGAELIGSRHSKEPDRFTGTGISIRKGSHVVIKNAIVKGFKVGVLAVGVNGLRIENSDFSYNFRQRLKSDRFREDLSDWQSYHHNEEDEWLRFGAGIYLKDCDSAVIHDNIITNGQCGLMMTNSHNGQIYNNNFSFNSGLGIGMYRSNRNLILHNKVDWNVRGYSYGYYYRGQDSGGILVFNQCSNNVFAHNSATHSGDGFFLWAGRPTVDQNIGGCNDNLIYGNDFSYAPTNAVEVTFSRNKVIKNKLHGCWHGIWGGFSYNTVIVKNDFGGNLAGISIEHGQDNIIEQNSFTADSLAIELWAIPNRKADFGLMNLKDTRSRNYTIAGNVFHNVPTVYSIKNTQTVALANNHHSNYRTLEKTDSLVKNLTYQPNGALYDYTPDSVLVASLLPGIQKQDALLPAAHPQGKKSIMMTEWGPYNFGYPILWWTDTDASGKMNFEIKGPSGRWEVKRLRGVALLSSAKGTLPGTLQVQKKAGDNHPITIELEYTGESFVSPFGETIRRGKRYRFHYSENSLPMTWDVSWFRFDSTSDPVKQPAAFKALLESTPVKQVQAGSLEYDRVKGKTRDLPRSRFATLVHTEVTAEKGLYRLGVTAGDIVRVYVDGRLVIDAWDPRAIVFDADYYKEAQVKLKGRHTIRIEQAQYGGYGMLNCTIKRIE